jgi:predicted metallopeptidase
MAVKWDPEVINRNHAAGHDRIVVISLDHFKSLASGSRRSHGATVASLRITTLEFQKLT